MAVANGNIERMFDESSTEAVVDAIGASARSENIACARRLAAIADERYDTAAVSNELPHR